MAKSVVTMGDSEAVRAQQQWASTGRPGLARTVHVRSGAAGKSAAGAASSDESSATTERRTGGLRPLVVAVERPGEAVDRADGVDATTPAVGPHVDTRRAVSRGGIERTPPKPIWQTQDTDRAEQQRARALAATARAQVEQSCARTGRRAGTTRPAGFARHVSGLDGRERPADWRRDSLPCAGARMID